MGANYMFAICSNQGPAKTGDAWQFVSAVGEEGAPRITDNSKDELFQRHKL